MSYKRLIPCIFIKDGKAVRWIDDPTVVSKDVIELAKYYSDHGADELIVLDLSDSDEEHDETITLMKRINRVIRIPMIAGGNIRRQEDIKKILYTGAKRAMLNFSKPDSVKLIEDAAKRFGKEKLAVSLNDFDALFKHQHLIQDYSSEIVFMHRLDLNSIMNVTDVPCVIITDTEEESELFKILKCPGVRGLSGRYVSRTDIDCVAFKDKCTEEGIKMTSFESMMEFSQFKTNDQGLIPVIVQHYKTQEILMLAYMNEESFYETIKTGKMTYFSRSRQKLWVKGETSGHFQYVKSLTIDCDLDTLLAKVDQIGAACHTGNPTCFFQPIVGDQYEEINTQQVFESVYHTIMDRKEHPKEGSYTNYLFEKGIDKILTFYQQLFVAKRFPYQVVINLDQIDYIAVTYAKVPRAPFGAIGYDVWFNIHTYDGSVYSFIALTLSGKKDFNQAVDFMKEQGIHFKDGYHILDALHSHEHLSYYLERIDKEQSK